MADCEKETIELPTHGRAEAVACAWLGVTSLCAAQVGLAAFQSSD